MCQRVIDSMMKSLSLANPIVACSVEFVDNQMNPPSQNRSEFCGTEELHFTSFVFLFVPRFLQGPFRTGRLEERDFRYCFPHDSIPLFDIYKSVDNLAICTSFPYLQPRLTSAKLTFRQLLLASASPLPAAASSSSPPPSSAPARPSPC